MATYMRPHIEPLTFRDAAGEIIDYGNRWVLGPPDDSYEVVDHPERFAPLHTVVCALIDYLAANFDVILEEGFHVTAGITNAPKIDDVVRAARITPQADGCAPIVFILTDFPGVWLHAGVHYLNVFPSCGCNACDENWSSAADELEWQTLAIAGGGFSETVSEPRRPKWSFDRGHGISVGMGQTVSYELRSLDGSGGTSGESRAEDIPPNVLAHMRTRLDQVAEMSPEGKWLPWPTRQG